MSILHIGEDGEISFVANPDLDEIAGELGAITKRRASHVVPVRLLPRILFKLIRRCVADESRAAEWTRGWNCDWRAEIIGGPVLGPFSGRDAAIAAEIDWIDQNVLSGD